MNPSKWINSVWTLPVTWLVVVLLALLLANAAPRDPALPGRLPVAVGQQIEQRADAFRRGERRMLALVTFRREHRQDVESWISGLGLEQDRSIAWVRMPVVDDSGDPAHRVAAETRLLARYSSAQERANLVPVFVDRRDFVQATGLPTIDRAHVLVINRNGDVLAHVAGEYNEVKAREVRETLTASDL